MKASRPSPLGGNPDGVALIRHVEKRYATVPGVTVTFTVPGLVGTGVLSLRSGVVVAQELRLKGGPADDIYVARRGKPSYKHTKLKQCWQPVSPTSGVTFNDAIGTRFPTSELTSVQAPKRVPGGWVLGGTYSDNASAASQKVVLVISSPSFLLRSITAQLANGKRLVYQVRALTTTPHLPTTSPVC